HGLGLGIAHDGGLTINDSAGGTGIVTLTSPGSTVNGGLKVVKGTVVLGAGSQAAQTLAGGFPTGTGLPTPPSATVTLPSVTGLAFGQAVTGGGLPGNTYITGITRVADPNNAGQFLFQVVLSNPLAAAASLTFAPTSVAGSTLNMAGGNVQTG